jgi:hypothetical protein
MATYTEPILNQPIETLGLSQDFIALTEMLGFYTLSDLLQHHTRDLLKLPGFTPHMIYEYIGFLDDHHLAHYVDPVI